MSPREPTLRFAAAALVSLLLHALVISGAWAPVPQPPGEPRPLEARLAPPPPVAKPAPPEPAARPKVKPRRAAPTVIAQSPLALPPEPQPEAAPAASAQATPAAPEPQPVAQPEPRAPEPAPARNLPKKGRITYTLLYGNDRFNVGKAVQSWEVESDTYMLASDAETTGIVDLFRPQRLRYLSKGKVTARGLKPESFLLSRTRRGETEAAQARFDWSAGSLTFGNASSVALPEGSQDIISFIYHFSLFPPSPGKLRLPITNGSHFETYEIEVFDEESIETPIGTLKALPVKQIRRAGAESIEIWLAAEYRYLPVKIRYFDREGNPSGEQVVSEIRLSEE